jgi:hypothetical protein
MQPLIGDGTYSANEFAGVWCCRPDPLKGAAIYKVSNLDRHSTTHLRKLERLSLSLSTCHVYSSRLMHAHDSIVSKMREIYLTDRET